MAALRLLLVEDQPDLCELLHDHLTEEGIDVTTASSGGVGLDRALADPPDVIVLDRLLPDIEGLEVLHRLRRAGCAAPVLFLTARSTVPERVAGLEAGAQDYLVKPFDLAELTARVRALTTPPISQLTVLRIVGGTFEPSARRCHGPWGDISLSARESALLEVLARSPRRTFSRAQLLDLAFGAGATATSEATVDTYVSYLRRKLGHDVIRTVHGLGYRLATPESS